MIPFTRTPIEPELVEVKGGFFVMGNDEGPDDERPAHEVWVDPFCMAKYCVTNHEYDTFVKTHKYPVQPPFGKEPNFNNPLQPVVGINWFDATAYCQWMSELSGRQYRLPYEAEWEFAACNGSRENVYSWGKRTWQEWPELHTRFQNGPEPVGSFEPNVLGIHDLCMNIHEWCSDWYHKGYYLYSPPWNPKGAQDGTRRSSRGGAWRHQIKITRCAARSSLPPGMRYSDYGFRVVLDLK